jgi:hypothetical protein
VDTFAPEVRNKALWSNDARRFVEGRAGEVYAEKLGLKELDDLSAVEHVQMGLVMQEPIMREFARRQEIRFKDADYALYHSKHPWLASHFDYISEDGKTLYEVKNLGVAQRKKFGMDGSEHISVGYRAQCLHEAAVHNIEKVVLVAMFGGQEICHYPQTFNADLIDLHIREMAELNNMPLWMVYIYMYALQGTPINTLYVMQRGDNDDIVLQDNYHIANPYTISFKQYLDNMK